MAAEGSASRDRLKESPPLIDMNFNMCVLKFFGLLAIEDVSWWKLWLHHVYSAMCFTMMAVGVVASICRIARDWEDFDAVVYNSCMTMCIFFITLRATYCNCRRGGMQRLIHGILEFEVSGEVTPINADGLVEKDRLLMHDLSEKQAAIMVAASRRIKIVTISFYGSCFASWLNWVVFPSFSDSSLAQQHSRPHPLMTVYFFDDQHWPNYELVYFFESVFLLLYINAVAGFDTIAVALLVHAGAQFQVLQESISCIQWPAHGENIDTLVDSTSIPTLFRQATSSQGNQVIIHAHHAIYNCIEHHVAIINYVKEYDKMFHHIMLCQFLYSAFIIALCGFQIIEGSDVGTILKFFFLLAALTFEMLMFCKCGDDIMLLSQQVGDAAFECKWFDGDVTAKRSVAMMITRSQRACHITAYHVKVMCLETFGALINASYTYLALLRQFKKNR